LVHDKALLTAYVNYANQEENVTFVGRLGTYRYLDMHVTVAEAIRTAEVFLSNARTGGCMPNFVVNPL
jgi:UDP-galactopyranose mutase